MLETSPGLPKGEEGLADSGRASRLPSLGGVGGGRESRNCIKFALLMAQYCLDQQIKVFGEALRNEFVSARDECQRYGANHSVFDQLAPTFTRDDLRALKHDCSESGLRNIIMRWKRDEWIEVVDRQHFRKTSQCPNATTSH